MSDTSPDANLASSPVSLSKVGNVIPIRGSNREDSYLLNRSLVLTLVHRHKGLSRSDLTKLTGLNRSTISSLVLELTKAGLVLENPGVPNQLAGRPSPIVIPNPNVVALAFGPRRYSATLSIVGLGGNVLNSITQTFKEPPDPFEMAHLANLMKSDLLKNSPKHLKFIGIGADLPGQVDISSGYVTFCEQLEWVDAPFAEYLNRATGMPAYIDNDSNLACAAERDFGSGRDFQNIIYLYGGDGVIGGGVIIDGNILRGSAGFAGELGHIFITEDQREDSSGLKGTLEALVRRNDLLSALRLGDISDDELTQKISKSKNNKLQRIMNNQIDYLAVGISTLVNIFNPQAVVLSGFLTALYEADDYRLLSKIRSGSVSGSRERVVIRTAQLGSKALAIGAAELAFAPLLLETSNFEMSKINYAERT